jgi:hypothetical protein
VILISLMRNLRLNISLLLIDWRFKYDRGLSLDVIAIHNLDGHVAITKGTSILVKALSHRKNPLMSRRNTRSRI